MRQITACMIIFFKLITVTFVIAQEDSYLTEYIELGIKQNLRIIQQSLEVEKSHQDIRNARGSLLPSLDVNARYTKANGGRSFQMPLGDLMNPVYHTLNLLVGEGTFQNIENQELNFNRTTDVDTRISITQPLYDSRLLAQNKIQNEFYFDPNDPLKRGFIFR